MTRIHERGTALPTQAGIGQTAQRQGMETPGRGERRALTENRSGILERVRGLLSGDGGGFSMENEDILLLLILYLMYRESGDREFLIVLAAMLFL